MERDRRSHRRHQFRCELRGVLLSSPETRSARAHPIEGRVEDLSAGGLRLLTDRSPTVSDLVQCELLFPQVPAPVRTLLQVRWVRQIPEGPPYLTGLQFLV